MGKFKFLLICLFVDSIELRFIGLTPDSTMQKLISYRSSDKLTEKTLSLEPEHFYYSPYQASSDNQTVVVNHSRKKKRAADSTFRGKPKTIQEVWARNFNLTSQEFSQSSSLINLMNKIILKYMGQCIPVILYDK